jgi:hypothetical protein
MSLHNKGYDVEFEMKNWFKGKCHYNDCVDFQTRTSLYEVKACNLLNTCTNGNTKRKYSGKTPHKKIITTQLGRFFIKNYNHDLLAITAKLENKIPKYIFVFHVGKQKMWRVKSWEFVNKLISESSENTLIRIKDIFVEGI